MLPKGILLCLGILLVTPRIWTQENAQLAIPHSLEECYLGDIFMNRDNRLPLTLNTLIGLIEKVETSTGFNQDIRQLSVSLLHRFRQDGIKYAPGVQASDSVIPYSPSGFQFPKFRILLSRLIPGNAFNFPNDTLSQQERCTLHFMLSSSLDMRVRGDEGQRCNQLSQFRAIRVGRSLDQKSKSTDNFVGDVEILDTLNSKLKFRPSGKIRNNGKEDDDNDDTSQPDYDDNPIFRDINLIDIASDSVSQCPVENGVIWTPYGTISAGNLIAGIAAGLQPQTVQLRALLALASRNGKKYSKQSLISVDNRWAATLAGDLAEVALIQAPASQNSVEVGANGAWNDTIKPEWYFLTQREKLELTDAEIRGGLDGLIIAMNIDAWRKQTTNMKLSQLLRMYYSNDGFNGIRACDRKSLFTEYAPIAMIKSQTSAFAQVLDREMQLRVTLREDAITKFSEWAAESLSTYIPQRLNDISCEALNPQPNDVTDSNTVYTDLYVFLDTSWMYTDINNYLIYIFEKMNVGRYGSRITLLNAKDCQIIVNTTDSLGDVYQYWNETTHQKYPTGLDLPNVLRKIQNLTVSLMNEEKKNQTVGGKSLIALVVPQLGAVNEADTNYATYKLQVIHEEIPDLKLLFFGGGAMSRFGKFVQTESKDLFSIQIGDQSSIATQSSLVVKRIREIPRRIINYRCGSSWSSSDWGASSMNQYVTPGHFNFYRVLPNYFFGEGNNRHVRIQAQGNPTIVCSSRSVQLPTINATSNGNINCKQMTTDTFDIDLSNACKDYYTIHECPPLYISVQGGQLSGSSSQANCFDNECQTPFDIRFIVQTDNLGCFSSSNQLLGSVLLIASLLFMREIF